MYCVGGGPAHGTVSRSGNDSFAFSAFASEVFNIEYLHRAHVLMDRKVDGGEEKNRWEHRKCQHGLKRSSGATAPPAQQCQAVGDSVKNPPSSSPLARQPRPQ